MRQFSYQRAEFLLVFNINLITVFSFFHIKPFFLKKLCSYSAFSFIREKGIFTTHIKISVFLSFPVRDMPVDAERRNIYVSDRRWKNIVRLLRTSAFMQDREEVDICDLLPIYHCLWQEPEERDAIRNIVIRALFSPFADKLVEMKNALAEDIKYHRVRRNPEDGRDYEGEIETLSDGLSSLEKQLGENLFASADDKAEISAYLCDFYKELAFTRQDTMKLYEV